jgi:hypothetical protein
VGLGDRLGLATPGHIAADPGSGFILVLAQQSIREMTRTERTAQQVMDEAVFGVFEVGYDKGFGSDADHLKRGLMWTSPPRRFHLVHHRPVGPRGRHRG